MAIERRVGTHDRSQRRNVISITTASFLIAAGFSLYGFRGCAAPIPGTSPTPSGEITPEPTVKPSPTIEVTPSPIETATPVVSGYSEKNGNILFTTENGEVINVPNLESYKLKAQIKNNKAIYTAEAGNAYGLKEGDYAGLFNPFVSEEQSDKTEKQTGGVGLIPTVSSTLLKQEVAKITTRADKWMYVIPLAGAGKDNNIQIKPDINTRNAPIEVINFSGDLTLTNPHLLSKEIVFGTSPYYGGYSVQDTSRLSNYPASNLIANNDPWHFFDPFGSFFNEDASGNIIQLPSYMPSKFGDKLCMAKKTIYLMFADGNGFYPVTPDKLLRVTDATTNSQYPVFLETASSK
jgi:hypothetical protein